MKGTKRRPITVYLVPEIAKAFKVKAAMTESTVSDLVNEALADRLRRDEADIRLVRERSKEPARDYDEFIAELRRDGLI